MDPLASSHEEHELLQGVAHLLEVVPQLSMDQADRLFQAFSRLWGGTPR